MSPEAIYNLILGKLKYAFSKNCLFLLLFFKIFYVNTISTLASMEEVFKLAYFVDKIFLKITCKIFLEIHYMRMQTVHTSVTECYPKTKMSLEVMNTAVLNSELTVQTCLFHIHYYMTCESVGRAKVLL